MTTPTLSLIYYAGHGVSKDGDNLVLLRLVKFIFFYSLKYCEATGQRLGLGKSSISGIEAENEVTGR